LDPQSPKGQHKARIFASALGLTAADADFLRQVLLHAARERECVPGEADQYGRRYTLEFELRTAAGRERIRSGWIVRTGEAFPRLTTCYVVKVKRTER
jgi:hypothetical protein